jgi:hypothetical protein
MKFFLRQFVLAMTWACAVLLLGEILMPGLVLPYLNLHLFAVAVLAANLLPLEDGEAPRVWTRVIAVAPIALLLSGYAYLLLSGHGPSAMLLLVASFVLIGAVAVAIIQPYAKH